MKILYAVLGLSLTVICVTGINIWLMKRRTRDYLNDLWTGVVWSAPPALALTAIVAVLVGWPSPVLFWVAMAAGVAWSARLGEPSRARRQLCGVTGALLALLVAGHLLVFGATQVSPAAWWVNGALGAIAFVMLALARRPDRVPAAA